MKRRIKLLPEDARAYTRNLSVGLIVGGVLALAISMPTWHGSIPVAIGLALGMYGCFTLEEYDQ